MIERVLQWLLPRIPDGEKSVSDQRLGWKLGYQHHIGTYMRRYILRLGYGGWQIRLHHILRSDAGRPLHDHPMSVFYTWLIGGGYSEVRPISVAADQVRGFDGWEYSSWPSLFNPSTHVTYDWADRTVTVRWPRFSLLRREGLDLHRLILDQPTWTIGLYAPKTRSWGFVVDGVWVDHKEHFKTHDPTTGEPL